MHDNIVSMDTRKKLETFIDKIIIRSNDFCRIEEIFSNNTTANKFLMEAKKEIDMFNHITEGRIYSNAISKMANYIKDIKKESSVSNFEIMSSKIHDLEEENRKLKAKLEDIYELSKTINEVKLND